MTTTAADPQQASITPPPPPHRQRKRTRRERLDADAKAQWAALKRELLANLRDLRDESEPSLQSPDLTRAALFRAPRLDEVPPRPAGPPPAADDESERARDWRDAMGSHLDALRMRGLYRRTDGLRPYATWNRQGAAGERGGKRPGESAFPAAWAPYLLRLDPGGQGADGWSSPLGTAFRRFERDYADTPGYHAVLAYTTPVPGDVTATTGVVGEGEAADPIWRVVERLSTPQRTWAPLSTQRQRESAQRYAERWLDAGARRLWAELVAVNRGSRAKAKDERNAAERAEAEAWERAAAVSAARTAKAYAG